METVFYRHNSLSLTGKLVWPTGDVKAGVLIIPTIVGPNPIMFDRAHWLASMGYVAMVSDIYGRGAVEIADAHGLANALRSDAAHYRARFQAALESFRQASRLDNSRIAVIGYCMGGQAALELARAGEEFAAAVSFHGLLDTKAAAEFGAVKPRILVLHGQKDPMVPPAQVQMFQDEMQAAGADWHMHIYANAKHGFTDPSSDARGIDALGYDLSADRQSKAAMLGLFEEVFG